jgi:hypothetical protein
MRRALGCVFGSLPALIVLSGWKLLSILIMSYSFSSDSAVAFVMVKTILMIYGNAQPDAT